MIKVESKTMIYAETDYGSRAFKYRGTRAAL